MTNRYAIYLTFLLYLYTMRFQSLSLQPQLFDHLTLEDFDGKSR